MKILAQAVLIFGACMILTGCDTEKVTGIYYTDHGDGLWIKENGEVHWSTLSKTKDDFSFLCMLTYDEKENKASFTFPSTSPFIGTTLRFSDDHQLIHVHWKRIDREPVEYRYTPYKKRKENK